MTIRDGTQAGMRSRPTQASHRERGIASQDPPLHELSRDRLDLYSISPSDRETFVRRYRSDLPEDRTAQPNVDLNAEEIIIPRV